MSNIRYTEFASERADQNDLIGFFACQSNDSNCVQKDDMAEVLDKMAKADVLAMATPCIFIV